MAGVAPARFLRARWFGRRLEGVSLGGVLRPVYGCRVGKAAGPAKARPAACPPSHVRPAMVGTSPERVRVPAPLPTLQPAHRGRLRRNPWSPPHEFAANPPRRPDDAGGPRTAISAAR